MSVEKLNKKMEIIGGEKTRWELVGVIATAVSERKPPQRDQQSQGNVGRQGPRVVTSWKRKWWQEKNGGGGDRGVGQPSVNCTTSGVSLVHLQNGSTGDFTGAIADMPKEMHPSVL